MQEYELSVGLRGQFVAILRERQMKEAHFIITLCVAGSKLGPHLQDLHPSGTLREDTFILCWGFFFYMFYLAFSMLATPGLWMDVVEQVDWTAYVWSTDPQPPPSQTHTHTNAPPTHRHKSVVGQRGVLWG